MIPKLTPDNIDDFLDSHCRGAVLLNDDEAAQLILTIQAETEKRVRKEIEAEFKRASTNLPAALGPFFTYTEWRKDSALRRQWAKTWELPHMKAGLQVLFSMGVPTTLKDLPPGLDFQQLQSVRAGRYEGYFDALKHIETLKKEPPKKGDKPVDGWGSANLNPTPEE